MVPVRGDLDIMNSNHASIWKFCKLQDVLSLIKSFFERSEIDRIATLKQLMLLFSQPISECLYHLIPFSTLLKKAEPKYELQIRCSEQLSPSTCSIANVLDR